LEAQETNESHLVINVFCDKVVNLFGMPLPVTIFCMILMLLLQYCWQMVPALSYTATPSPFNFFNEMNN
jgi:hypothetical protein